MAGIVFGSGKGNRNTRGVLPDAQMFYTNPSAIIDARVGSTANGSRYALTKELVESYQIMFQYASFGWAPTEEYNVVSRELDKISLEFGRLPIIQSQGDYGTPLSRPQALAKNVISVGSIFHNGTPKAEDDHWGPNTEEKPASSIGPTKDGRVKPDVAGFTDHILAAAKGGGYDERLSMTSAASPFVAGCVGLIIEMWTDGLLGNTLNAPKTDRFANRPGAQTVKALLLASARQYEFTGRDADLSRMHQGRGIPDPQWLFEKRDKVFAVDQTDILAASESKTYEIEVAADEPLLKICMAYADPPGKKLVNNLDLKVTAPDGTVYHGNHGLLDGPYSTPGGSPQAIDNVENVIVKQPAAGKWKIEVTAQHLKKDAHLETSALDADFGLAAVGGRRVG